MTLIIVGLCLLVAATVAYAVVKAEDQMYGKATVAIAVAGSIAGLLLWTVTGSINEYEKKCNKVGGMILEGECVKKDSVIQIGTDYR